ncbi:MAG: cardiolipin synthase [Treponema sp.]|nr:cardiolipin synthase [Treponema sp.]
MAEKKISDDLNTQIIANNRSKEIFRRILFSRVILSFILLVAQVVLLMFFIFRFEKYLDSYLLVSLGVSILFVIYLTNTEQQNEFKIAWMIPAIIVPLFGVFAYTWYHLDSNGIRISKKLSKLRKKTDSLLPEKKESLEVLERYSDFKDIGYYLLNSGNYYAHDDTKIKYFPNGETFFPDFIESLRNAKEYIFLEYFIIGIDECWTQILEILEQKVKEGVEVRVMCDGIGTFMTSSRSYQKFLASKGIKTKVFLKLLPILSVTIDNRDHRKITIIDGKVGYTGGLNISNQYFNYGKNRFSYWKDNAIRMEGTAIRNLTQMFLQTWNIQGNGEDDFEKFMCRDFGHYESEGLIIPYGDDLFNRENIAEDIYLHLINTSKKYLYITTPYIIIDNQMISAMKFAAKRGVDIRVIVPSVPDHLLTFCLGRVYLKSLLDAGVKVYLYKEGFIHAKTFISDDKIATVGTINLDYRSLVTHFECGTLIAESHGVYDIKSDFDDMFENEKVVEMKAEDYKKIPAWQRFAGRLLKVFGPAF